MPSGKQADDGREASSDEPGQELSWVPEAAWLPCGLRREGVERQVADARRDRLPSPPAHDLRRTAGPDGERETDGALSQLNSHIGRRRARPERQ